ncbi:hypothetical protein BaRGS_00006982, partial [Batillaria attramentaria]
FPQCLRCPVKIRPQIPFLSRFFGAASTYVATMAAAADETQPPPSASSYKQPYFQLDPNTANNGPVDTDIIGQVPEWLEGSLFRNGPGIFTVGETRLRHLFDGFAVLHRFDLHQGKVTYTSRVLDSESWERSVKANRLVTTQFGTYAHPDPCKTLFSRVMSYFKPRWEGRTDNTSVNIVEHGDRLYTLTETPVMLSVDPKTLQIAQKDTLDRVIAVHMSTAHPHFDREGNMYNLGTAFNPPNNYNIIKIAPAKSKDDDPLSTATLQASLTSRWTWSMGYNHSFGMSRDHYVILEQPVTMASFKFLTCNWRRASVFENFDKHPGVEENGELVVDFVGYSSLDVIDSLYVDRLDETGVASVHPIFRRYVLPLSLRTQGSTRLLRTTSKDNLGTRDIVTGGHAEVDQNLVRFPHSSATAVLRKDGTVFLTPDIITEDGSHMELPRINYDMANGTRYRYVYGTSLFSHSAQLKKLDLDKKQELAWGEEGYQPGEPVFVSRPGAVEEDDGVILSPVISLDSGKPCFLLILDAGTFKELARAVTPASMKWALSFHGTYLPQNKPQ